MHFLQVFAQLAVVVNSVQALAANDPCEGVDGSPGVCITAQSCTSNGGTFVDTCGGGNLQCCSKARCGTGANIGDCRFTADCQSEITFGSQCPGPKLFRCCMPPGSTWPMPSVPSLATGCKQVSIDGANLILGTWAGRIKTVGCFRQCGPGARESDHCGGLATDLMVSDLGIPSTLGEEIAVWVMNNHAELELDYVMWGQRYWGPSRGVKPFEEWEWQKCLGNPPANCFQGDRGSVTENHWDHVHVSFEARPAVVPDEL